MNITGENNEEIYQVIIQDVITNYNSTEGTNFMIKTNDDHNYEITTIENEKTSLYSSNKLLNLSKIDLGECEYLLKDYYHINRNISLIIIKYEKITNNPFERSLQYELYEPYNKTKLNLSICNNVSISIYIPVKLSKNLLNLYDELKEQGYDLFDINGEFYQGICTPFTSPNGTDVLLSDRKIYYFNNNETLCQSNCIFSNYSVESGLLKCDCDSSNADINTKEIKKINEKSIYQAFHETLKFSNYKVLRCYNLAFSKRSVTTNKGSIIVIIYFCFYLAFLFLYYSEGIRQELYLVLKEN